MEKQKEYNLRHLLAKDMRKSVGQAPTAGEQKQQNPCRASSDIGAELENHSEKRSDVGSERVNLTNIQTCFTKTFLRKLSYLKNQSLTRSKPTMSRL
jgi:hypothetical protein